MASLGVYMTGFEMSHFMPHSCLKMSHYPYSVLFRQLPLIPAIISVLFFCLSPAEKSGTGDRKVPKEKDTPCSNAPLNKGLALLR
jgi:hypothetical protein